MSKYSWFILLFAWVVSLIATLGSLFLSDVLGFPPCTMCWYQRICMYPLTIILLVGLIRQEKLSIFYSAPLVFVGLFWSIYHNLLIFDIIEESLTPCSFGVPCSVKYINWLGFIDIPMLSFFAFMLIATSLIVVYKKEK